MCVDCHFNIKDHVLFKNEARSIWIGLPASEVMWKKTNLGKVKCHFHNPVVNKNRILYSEISISVLISILILFLYYSYTILILFLYYSYTILILFLYYSYTILILFLYYSYTILILFLY